MISMWFPIIRLKMKLSQFHIKAKNVQLEKQNSNWSENLIDKIFPHE